MGIQKHFINNNPNNNYDPLGLKSKGDCWFRCSLDATVNLTIGWIAGKVPGLELLLMVAGLNIPDIQLFQATGGYGPVLDIDILGVTQAGTALIAGSIKDYGNEIERLSDLTNRKSFKSIQPADQNKMLNKLGSVHPKTPDFRKVRATRIPL